MNPLRCVLLLVVSLLLMLACACWAVGPPRTSTPVERATAAATVDAAEAAGRLSPQEADRLHELIAESETVPQSWQQIAAMLLTLGLGHLVQRIDRGPPERVRRKRSAPPPPATGSA